jgi:Zn-dependent alcohol dehydrogenase
MQIKAAVVSERSNPFVIETVELCAPRPVGRMSAFGVRREKAALSSGCKPHPATAYTQGYIASGHFNPAISSFIFL